MPVGERFTQLGYLVAGASPLAGSSAWCQPTRGGHHFCVLRGGVAWANSLTVTHGLTRSARNCTPKKTHVNLDVWPHVRENVVDIATRYFDESRCIPDTMNRVDISFEPTVYQTMRVIAALMASGYEQGRTTPKEVFNERFILWYLDNSKITVNIKRATRKYAILILRRTLSRCESGGDSGLQDPSVRQLPTYTVDEIVEFRQAGFDIGAESRRVPYLGALALTLGAGVQPQGHARGSWGRLRGYQRNTYCNRQRGLHPSCAGGAVLDRRPYRTHRRGRSRRICVLSRSR